MRTICCIALGSIALLAGCQTHQQESARPASSAVLDVHPAARTASLREAAPQQVIPPDEPTVPVYAGPLTLAANTHTATATPAPATDRNASGEYKVKKGDTLYRIAKSQYGDGKKWTLIASANPGLSPTALHAGQMIVLP